MNKRDRQERLNREVAEYRAFIEALEALPAPLDPATWVRDKDGKWCKICASCKEPVDLFFFGKYHLPIDKHEKICCNCRMNNARL